MNRKYLINTKIGNLTIIGYQNDVRGKQSIYICKCDCMALCKVDRQQFYRGKTSCGCMVETTEVKISPRATEEEKKLEFSPITSPKSKDITDLDIGKCGYVIGYKGKNQWWLKCSCGKIFTATQQSILKGAKKSKIAGCRECAYKESGERNSLHLEGQRFGKLVVIEKTENRSIKGSVMWRCLCDCGKTIETRASSLTSGVTRSCSCVLKEAMQEKALTYCGKNHHLYREDISDEDREHSQTIRRRTRRIRDIALKRDNHQCSICGNSENLVGHHKDGYNWCKERRMDLSNFATLCEFHHDLFHKLFGIGNNTEIQFNIFLQTLENLEGLAC